MPSRRPLINSCSLGQFESIVHGNLTRRYKRFLADVQLAVPEGSDDSVDAPPLTVVHCPNTGAMAGLLDR